MRLFLLPISTRRTLLFCQRPSISPSERQGLLDKATARAARLWAAWERKPSGWQRRVVDYGNHALRRIPFEEWGLKSVPPLGARRRLTEKQRGEPVELVFPAGVIAGARAEGVLRRLGTEREGFHRRRLLWCLVGMPVTAPFALVPIIPNLPFFYLVYRAWSHWRALSGSKHIQFLLASNLLKLSPSPLLDRIYEPKQLPLPGQDVSATQQEGPAGKDDEPEPEMMLMSHDRRKLVAEELDLPEVEAELDRAVWQVEQVLKKRIREEAASRDEGVGEKKSR